jgi:hypothetical protein
MPDDQTPKGTEEITPEIEKPEEQPLAPAVDYEKKFAESTRENQLLRERIAAEELQRQESTKEPTDSDYRAAFPSWDLYDDTQKELARRTFGSERTARNAAQLAQDLQSERSWNTSIELVIAANDALQGKEQAFRQYASKPQYKNVPMDVLVDAFLQKSGAAPAPKTTPKPGLEPGNGGPKETPKPKGLTMEQLSALRKSDPKAYEKYIKTHTIEVDF